MTWLGQVPGISPEQRGREFPADDEYEWIPPVPDPAVPPDLDPVAFMIMAAPGYRAWETDGVWARVPIGATGTQLTVNADGSVGWGSAGGLTTAAPPSGDTTGVTDTASLQALIDAAWHAGGGIVFLPVGVYYIKQLILRNSILIWGSGEGSVFPDPQTGLVTGTILRAPIGNTTHMIVPDPVPTSISSPGLMNLTLDGNNGPVPSAYNYTATNASPCVFTATGNSSAIGPPSYANGNAVQLSQGTPPPPNFSNGTTYYVVAAQATIGNSQSFSLAATPGGAAINSTGTGTGGVVTQLPNQTPNAFDIIHIAKTVIRFKFINVTVYGSPNDGIFLSAGSMGGSFMVNVNVQQSYANGINTSCSDMHYTNVEVGITGQNGIVVGGQFSQFANCKANTSGSLGLGAGTEDAWHISGGTNVLAGCVSENCAPAVGSGNGLYVSGNRNRLDFLSTGAGGSLLYLDGCVYNDIRMTVSNQTNNAQPNYIYTINTSATKNNRVQIKGDAPGTTPVISYANLTNSGSELNNEFRCEGEQANAAQLVAFNAAGMTIDPYLGGNIQIATITASMTGVIGNPINGHPGSFILFRLLQNAGGGNTVSFGTAYKLSAAIPTTGNTATMIGFTCDSTGTTWRETYRATA